MWRIIHDDFSLVKLLRRESMLKISDRSEMKNNKEGLQLDGFSELTPDQQIHIESIIVVLMEEYRQINEALPRFDFWKEWVEEKFPYHDYFSTSKRMQDWENQARALILAIIEKSDEPVAYDHLVALAWRQGLFNLSYVDPRKRELLSDPQYRRPSKSTYGGELTYEYVGPEIEEEKFTLSEFSTALSDLVEYGYINGRDEFTLADFLKAI